MKEYDDYIKELYSVIDRIERKEQAKKLTQSFEMDQKNLQNAQGSDEKQRLSE